MSQGGDCPGAPPTGEGTRPVGRRSTSRRVDIPELKRRYSIERALGLPEGSLRPGDPVQCPDASHPDDAPSAQIGRNGDIVWCHVCCCPGDKPWDVIKLYQMLRAGGRSLSFGETIREMAAEVGMSSPPSRSRRRGSEKATTADPIVAEYIYVNENGADLFRVTRHEAPGKKKTFCQWHRDGDGEWVSGLGGIKPVVYRLPELTASDSDRWVLIVEGEKCVEVLVGLGFIATCSPMGAGKWRDEYAQYFEGRKVAILPDNDDPGRRHAVQIAKSLVGVAAEVRIVDLPSLPPKGDVVDWVEAGGTPLDLRRHLDASVPATEETLPILPETEATGDWRRHPLTGVPLIEIKFDSGDHVGDTRNSLLFSALFRDNVRCVSDWNGRFMTWDGRRWFMDSNPSSRALALTAAVSCWYRVRRDELLERVESSDNVEAKTRLSKAAKHFSAAAAKADSAGARRCLLTLAGTLPGIAVQDHRLVDDYPWHFNVLTGVIDLKTGELLPHDPSRLITKLAPVEYAPGAEAPRFRKFVAEVLPDPDVRAFVQRLFGLALIGLQLEEILAFFYGSGANGKTTLLAILGDVFGDYYSAVPLGFLEDNGRGDTQHPTEIANLYGVRLAVASEVEENSYWKESKVKQLTGGDERLARRMREDFWKYKPSETLIVIGNHRPRVRGADRGIWRRLLLVPFEQNFEGRADKTLRARLANEEGGGILAWAVEGLLDYLARGNDLAVPAAVRLVTAAYAKESDLLGRFLEERYAITGDPDDRMRAGELYEAFKEWWQDSHLGREPWSNVKFAKQLGERPKVGRAPTNKANYWTGIRPRSPQEDEPEDPMTVLDTHGTGRPASAQPDGQPNGQIAAIPERVEGCGGFPGLSENGKTGFIPLEKKYTGNRETLHNPPLLRPGESETPGDAAGQAYALVTELAALTDTSTIDLWHCARADLGADASPESIATWARARLAEARR